MRRGQTGGWRGGPANRTFRQRSGGNSGYKSFRPHIPGGPGPHRYPMKYNSPRVPWSHHHHQANTSRSSNSEEDSSPNKDERTHHYDNHSSYHHRNFDPYPPRAPHREKSFHDVYMKSINFSSNTQKSTYWQNPQTKNHNFGNKTLLRTPDLLPYNQEYNDKNKNRHRDYERQDYDRHYHERDKHRNSMSDTSQQMENNSLRPTTSNYFENNTPRSDDSKTFTHSVDDTVSIIKERLMNRHNPSNSATPVTSNDAYTDNNCERNVTNDNLKKSNNNRHKRKNQNIKLSLDFKNKIIGQLFNMDKDTIHKLMDNPNCSTKFEYAINSLITESQNSYNRHTRAAAEKSLYGDYIENDTIYEDTFMKQMQCVLNPKETVVLEDLKPFVMAELNKILQIDEFSNNNQIEAFDEDKHLEDSKDFYYYAEDIDNMNNSELNPYVSSQDESHYEIKSNCSEHNSDIKYNIIDDEQNEEEPNGSGSTDTHQNCKPLTQFEDNYEYKKSERKSVDKVRQCSNNNDDNSITTTAPLFENTLEQLSDEEDPFEDLDNQYHVVVDPTLIDTDFTKGDSKNRSTPDLNNKDMKQKTRKSDLESNQNESHKHEKSKSPGPTGKNDYKESKNSVETKIKIPKKNSKRSMEEPSIHSNNKKRKKEINDEHNKQQNISSNNSLRNIETACNALPSTEIPILKIKRIKQKINDFEISNKKNVKCKKVSPLINVEEKDEEEHVPLNQKSPTDSADGKTKLKTFDMFKQKPRIIQVHQARRNTAPIQEIKTAIEEKYKEKHTPSLKQVKVIKRTVACQAVTKTACRFTQTQPKLSPVHKNKSIQTDENFFHSTKLSFPSSNVYERMKEIDLEIQVLLQEKFKLYNSLESKDKSKETITNVGMAVLNVDLMDSKNESVNELSEDTIIDDIAKLSEEELEKIAFEGLESSEYIPEDATVNVPSEKASKRVKKKGNSKMKKKQKPNINKNKQHTKDLEDILKEKVSPMKTRHRRTLVSTDDSSSTSSQTFSDYLGIIKPCSVILIKKGIKELMDNLKASNRDVENAALNYVPEYNSVIEEVEKFGNKVTVEEIPVINEFHFQDQVMVISEDIVIDSNIEGGDCINSQDISLTDVCEEVVDNSSVDSGDIQLQNREDNPPPEEDTPSRVYDMDDSDTISVVGHLDSVLAIECIDNNFVAACVNGNMHHFDSNGQLLSTIKVSCNYGVSCLCIVEDSSGVTVYAGSLDARIRYYDLNTGLEKGPECNVLSPIQSMDRAWDIIYVGTRMGFVHQFECKNGTLFPLSRKQFSEQPILALKALKEGPRKVLLVASRTENVTIKDAQTGLLLRTLDGSKLTIYSLLYEEGKVFCGNPSNQIQAFDFATGNLVDNLPAGRGCICLRSAGTIIFAGCYNGSVYVFKSGRTTPMAILGGRSSVLLALAINNNKLIVAYNDRSLYIWKIPVHILEEMIL